MNKSKQIYAEETAYDNKMTYISNKFFFTLYCNLVIKI